MKVGDKVRMKIAPYKGRRGEVVAVRTYDGEEIVTVFIPSIDTNNWSSGAREREYPADTLEVVA